MNDNSLQQFPQELHRRSSAGIQVSLWWSGTQGRTWVAVRDVRTGAAFVLPVADGDRARDVFDHPYAHAARRGIPTTHAA